MLESKQKLHVLLVEDAPQDAFLILNHLEQCGFALTYQVVEKIEDFQNALSQHWDVILSDYVLPGFNSLEGLDILQHSGKDIPFLLVSRTVTEEVAVKAMGLGVHDYIPKDNLSRLGVVINREVRDANYRKELLHTKAALEAQNDLNQAVIKMVTNDIFTFNISPQKEIIDLLFNQAVYQTSGLLKEEFENLGWINSHIIPEDLPAVKKSIDDLLAMKECEFDFRYLKKNGDIVWLHEIAQPLRRLADGTVRVIGAIQDITGQKQNQLDREVLLSQLNTTNNLLLKQAAELKQRADDLALIFETASDAIIIYDSEGVVVRANPSAASSYGLDPTGIHYLDLAKSLTLKDHQGNLQKKTDLLFPRLRRGETIQNQISTMINAKGHEVVQLLSAAPMIENGHFKGGLVTWKDITTLEISRKALEEQERTLRGVIENSIDGIVLVDENGTILKWSKGMEQITGITGELIIGQPLWEVQVEFFSPQGNTKLAPVIIKNSVLEFLKTGKADWLRQNIEIGIRHQNSQENILESNLFTIPTAHGVILGVVTRDITERKLAEIQIREARDFYLNLFELFPAMIWRTDRFGRLDYINQALMEFTNQPAEALLGDRWMEFIHPEDCETALEHYSNAVKDAKSYQLQYRFLYRDGSYRWIKDVGTPFKDPNNNFGGIIGACFDIHETLQHQKEMEVVLAISMAMRTAKNTEEITQILLDQLMRLVNAKGSAIMDPTPDGETLKFQTRKGACAMWTGNDEIPIDNSLCGQVFSSREPILNIDLRMNPSFLFGDSDHDFNFGLIEPLIAQGMMIGVLCLNREIIFTPEEIRLVRAVADIAATAIHRQTLIEEARLYAQNLTVIGAMGRAMAEMLDSQGIYRFLAQAVADVFDVRDYLIVSRYLPEDATIECDFLMQDGITQDPKILAPIPLDPSGNDGLSWVVLNRQSKIVNDPPFRLQLPADGIPFDPLPLSALLVPMISGGRVLGVLQVQSCINRCFGATDADLLGLIANTAAIALDNANLFSNLVNANQDLVRAYDTTLEGWASALELRDQETRGHSHDVVEMAIRVARAAEIPEEEIQHIRRGALLHDIGKMGIPDKILLKDGPLNEQEWEIMRKHPVYAFELLGKIDYLQPALEIPYCHHEHWDGKGYPRGLAGEHIPLSARIFALVDVWNALQRDRPYRKAWSRDKVIVYIREQTGKQFDPELAELFLRIVGSEN